MKKSIMKLEAVLLVCVVSVLALPACKVALEQMDGSEYYDATYKERCVELVSDFFEETLKDPDFVVTCEAKYDNRFSTFYTETVKGTSSHTLYANGSEDYVFLKGAHYYAAEIRPSYNKSEETRTYACSDSTKPGYYAGTPGNTMEDIYKNNYCRFMGKDYGAGIFGELKEEDAIFHASVHIERVSNYPTGELEVTYIAENAFVTLTASSAGGKVNSAHLVRGESAEDEPTTDLTWTFVYGGATIVLPDTDAWDDDE